jgi:hypothetical protein
MIDNVNIEIQYLLKTSQEWQSFKLDSAEYFELEIDETIELNCIPKYNHAIDYITEHDFNINSQEILATKIILIDFRAKKQRQIQERFWHNAQNRLIERIDLDLTQFQIQDHEIIIETKINNNPPQWEILRLNQQNQMINPIFHSFIQENPDGSETENQIEIESFSLLENQTFVKQLV